MFEANTEPYALEKERRWFMPIGGYSFEMIQTFFIFIRKRLTCYENNVILYK